LLAAVIILLILAPLAWVVFIFFTKRGRGVLFGGRIVKTFDGVAAKRKILSHRIRIHAVESGAHRLVGLEISSSSVASYQMLPLTLPAHEAKQLAQLLIEAADYPAQEKVP
jgi:hypothetical protein